eukprot:m51a1_g730 hypothetical protein (947) ;mRNA; r:471507-475649
MSSESVGSDLVRDTSGGAELAELDFSDTSADERSGQLSGRSTPLPSDAGSGRTSPLLLPHVASAAESNRFSAHIASLERQLEEAKSTIELQQRQFLARERELMSSASSSLQAVFGAIPVRCGSLESGRFRIKEDMILSALACATGFVGAVVHGLALDQHGTGSLRVSFDQRTPSITSEIPFKRTYTEKPKVAVWIMRQSRHAAERVETEALKIGLSGFELHLTHADPRALIGSIINWIAYTSPQTNPQLASAISAVMAAKSFSQDLERQLTKFLQTNTLVDIDASGQTLLHVASYCGNTALVKWLVKKGAEINAVDEHGWTPLLCAISPGHFRTAQKLIELNADCAVLSESNSTALHYLCRCSGTTSPNLDIVARLLKAGASPFQANLQGITPIHTAFSTSNVQLMELLLRDCEIQIPTAMSFISSFASAAEGEMAHVLTSALLRRKTNRTEQKVERQVHVVEARIGGGDRTASNDFYCLVRYGKTEYRTAVSYRSSNPVWNEEFNFQLDPNLSFLTLELWSCAGIKQGFVAMKLQAPFDVWTTLTPARPPKEGLVQPTAEVHVRITQRVTSEIITTEMDLFSSIVFPREDWIRDSPPSWFTGVDWDACLKSGMHIETSYASVTHEHPFKKDFDFGYAIQQYHTYFYGKDHVNVLCADLPTVISIENPSPTSPTAGVKRVIVHTRKEDRRMLVSNFLKNESGIAKVAVPELANLKLSVTHNPTVPDLLLKFEQFCALQHKVALLYAPKGIKTERQILKNLDESVDFQAFCLLMGKKVPLMGWGDYRAGLDTKGNTNGTHSIYTAFGGVEIMYHMPTMLPTTDVEERRHFIRGDTVIVIFKEYADANDAVDLSSFTSPWTCVFIVVTPDPTPDHFRVTVVSKPQMKPFPPYIPSDTRFSGDLALREFLLKKIINAERAIQSFTEFGEPMRKIREGMLLDIIQAAGHH